MKRLLVSLLFALVAGAALAPETATALQKLSALHGLRATGVDRCPVQAVNRLSRNVSAAMCEMLASLNVSH